MKKLQFFSIFLVVALLAGLLSTTAVAAPEESDTFENLTISAKAALLVDAARARFCCNRMPMSSFILPA